MVGLRLPRGYLDTRIKHRMISSRKDNRLYSPQVSQLAICVNWIRESPRIINEHVPVPWKKVTEVTGRDQDKGKSIGEIMTISIVRCTASVKTSYSWNLGCTPKSYGFLVSNMKSEICRSSSFLPFLCFKTCLILISERII